MWRWVYFNLKEYYIFTWGRSCHSKSERTMIMFIVSEILTHTVSYCFSQMFSRCACLWTHHDFAHLLNRVFKKKNKTGHCALCLSFHALVSNVLPGRWERWCAVSPASGTWRSCKRPLLTEGPRTEKKCHSATDWSNETWQRWKPSSH